MKGTYKGALRLPLFIGAHALWWIGLAMSLVVSFFSHWFGVFAYSDPCVGEGCTSYFNMDASQFEGMARYGISSDLYAAFTVILLAIQNLSSWAVGFLLYRYGWRDLYCVTASLLLIVTGTIFSSDDALFANYPALTQMFFVLNSFGSMYIFFLFLFPEGRSYQDGRRFRPLSG
ncbi:hypothetical protein [Paenibacillus prosopidis]|uniref:Uncharacterized protein n=1 Tax=Paenibacillus prosopidis TaxID=630520 RepID=A0A368W4P4_9BACL|nr:hypothetical protein [Paenibacillus prosopidis]RCW50054.1 hypothetical protein DFP97_10370 [Paenibacillus prosopidis]